jgi:transposase
MSAMRLSMRKTKDILRLAQEAGLTNRQIARSLNISATTVGECLKRAREANIAWPLPEGVDDEILERALYGENEREPSKPVPEWKDVHKELARKGVTLMLLWEEYRENYLYDHYSYSRFCEHYRRWRASTEISMRQDHKAGEKLFTDFAGMTIPIVDPETGEISQAEVFVATHGFSNYTYVEAVPSQELAHWTGVHVRAFSFFGGTPEILVPDNIKTGVTHACRYEPDINQTYADMAEHYSCVVIPTRVRAPKDKAKVENGVQQAERWVLAPLRNRVFHSIAEANRAIRERVKWLNNRRMKLVDASRAELFRTVDLPALRPLPERPYELQTWKKAKVSIDYHIEIDGHYYSVSYRLIGEKVEVRLTPSTVEVFHKGVRHVAHPRSYVKGRATTLKEHMPASHRAHLEWTPSRIISWAEETGPATAKLVDEIMSSKPHPEMEYRSCLGIIRLSERFGSERMEAASARAVSAGAFSYKSVKSILSAGLDRINEQDDERPAIPQHDNVRGPDYYN